MRLLLDHLVIRVHLPHQLDVTLVHVFHVVLDARNMSFGELDGHQILDAILRLQAIFFLFALLLRLLIVVHLIYLFIVRTDTKLVLLSSKVLTAYYTIVDVILLILVHLVV